jgi:hypothetical protein
MKTKDIEPSQYAAWYGCSLQNVTKRLRQKKKLEGVIRVKRFSRFYLLEVAADMNAETFKDMNDNELPKKVKPKK